MLISIGTQFNLILFNILAGILTGILFDIYRLIRGFENPNTVITLIEDVLFWIFTSLAVFAFLLYTGFVYVGVQLYIYIALGIYIYLKIASTFFLKVQYRLIKASAKAFRIMINLFLYPIQLIFYSIVKKNK